MILRQNKQNRQNRQNKQTAYDNVLYILVLLCVNVQNLVWRIYATSVSIRNVYKHNFCMYSSD